MSNDDNNNDEVSGFTGALEWAQRLARFLDENRQNPTRLRILAALDLLSEWAMAKVTEVAEHEVSGALFAEDGFDGVGVQAMALESSLDSIAMMSNPDFLPYINHLAAIWMEGFQAGIEVRRGELDAAVAALKGE